MSEFPSLDDFESGTTTVQPRQLDDEYTTPGQTQFPDIGDNGDLLNADEQFQSSFPALPDHARPSSITHPNQSLYQSQDSVRNGHAGQEGGQGEPECITQWRARQSEQISQRDANSARIKSERVAAARKAVDDFYDSYNARRESKIQALRISESERASERDEATSGGTTWERVLKFVDFKEKRGEGDVTRMRELLVSLAKDRDAPSAGL